MKSTKFLTVFAAMAISCVLAGNAMAQGKGKAKATFKPGPDTIADVAIALATAEVPEFTTLVTALQCDTSNGLLDAAFNEDAELTVFAPTDAAFGKAGLNAGNICAAPLPLTEILSYHVVGERRPSPSVINGKNKQIEMFQGGFVYPNGMGSTVLKDELDRSITITWPDVLASNGIIHVVDTVLFPSALGE